MGKKYTNAKKLIDKRKKYTLDEALDLLPKISVSKFPGSIELTINLNLSEKQKNGTMKGSVVFPHQFGNTKTILALVEASKENEAKKAGADYVGLDEYIKKIESGWMDFDIVIATPSVMPKIAKLGKYIGKKGLMPNPKNQTVTNDISKVVEMYKKGKTDYKINEQNILHIIFGKLDQDPKELKANFESFKQSLLTIFPRFTKEMIRSIFVKPTMGPSIKLVEEELI